MPFCRECGKEVQEDWKTCPHCSISLTESSQSISIQDSAVGGDIITTVNDSEAIKQGYLDAKRELMDDERARIRFEKMNEESEKIGFKKSLLSNTLREHELEIRKSKQQEYDWLLERIYDTCASYKNLISKSFRFKVLFALTIFSLIFVNELIFGIPIKRVTYISIFIVLLSIAYGIQYYYYRNSAKLCLNEILWKNKYYDDAYFPDFNGTRGWRLIDFYDQASDKMDFRMINENKENEIHYELQSLKQERKSVSLEYFFNEYIYLNRIPEKDIKKYYEDGEYHHLVENAQRASGKYNTDIDINRWTLIEDGPYEKRRKHASISTGSYM